MLRLPPHPLANTKPVNKIASAIKKILKNVDIEPVFLFSWQVQSTESAHLSLFLSKSLNLLKSACAVLVSFCAGLALICAAFVIFCALLVFYPSIYLFIYLFEKKEDIYKGGREYKHLLNARVKYFLIFLMRGFLLPARVFSRSYLKEKFLLIQWFKYADNQVRGCAACFAPGSLLYVNRSTLFTLINGVIYE